MAFLLEMIFNHFEITEYCKRDLLATFAMNTIDNEKRELVLATAYMLDDTDESPTEIHPTDDKNLVDYCKNPWSFC